MHHVVKSFRNQIEKLGDDALLASSFRRISLRLVRGEVDRKWNLEGAAVHPRCPHDTKHTPESLNLLSMFKEFIGNWTGFTAASLLGRGHKQCRILDLELLERLAQLAQELLTFLKSLNTKQ